ncbi:Potassium channel [Trichinella spiralis]|uniref:Potassium channel n=1 Tax=Trichinella spiralis TaxID=6334 RepID=A0ABR3K8K0_TRISP
MKLSATQKRYTTLVIHGRPRTSNAKHKAKAACLRSVGDSNGSKQRDTIDKTIKPFIAHFAGSLATAH